VSGGRINHPNFSHENQAFPQYSSRWAGSDGCHEARQVNRRLRLTLTINHQFKMKTIPMPDKSTMNPTILIAENGAEVLRQIKSNGIREGFEFLTVSDGATALLMLPRISPDLIVLDIDSPKTRWTEFCQLIRNDQAISGIPILILTSRPEEAQSLADFGLGNTDFAVKPINPQELMVRIKRLLHARQITDLTGEKMAFDDLELDLTQHEVTVQGNSIRLTYTEFKLLITLAQRRGRVQSRERLLADVCDYSGMMETRTIDTHMRRLRSKLGSARWHLETVRGVGYRFSKTTRRECGREMAAPRSKVSAPQNNVVSRNRYVLA
jgi:two-component system phosphate regulon response regulator PhoB